MEEIKVENNDVVDTTKPEEETTPATPVEEVKTEDTTESTEEKKDNSDKIMVSEYTDEFLDEKNFIELERIRKANLRNKDTLDNMKTTVEGMVKFYQDNKDLLEASREYGVKIHDEAEESEDTDFSKLLEYPAEFQESYDLNVPIIEANDKKINEFIQKKYGNVRKCSSFYTNELRNTLEKNIKAIKFSKDENGNYTIPKESFTNLEKISLKSLENSLNAVNDRPNMIYMISHCINYTALINTWKAVRKDYKAADDYIRKVFMPKSVNRRVFTADEFRQMVMLLTMMSDAFYARMLMYQIARVIDRGHHDGTDMYGRLFCLNISDYANNRYDLNEEHFLDVIHTILQAYVNYSHSENEATRKRYMKSKAYQEDLALQKELEGYIQERKAALLQAQSEGKVDALQ